jgi:hypothetical protein
MHNHDMKYEVLFLIFLMLVHTNCSPNQSGNQAAPQTEDLPTIRLRMSHQSALEVIRQCGGQDITRNLAIQGPNGERPDDGLYWDLAQYNAVLEIGAKDGLVVGIGYWTSADFSKNKEHRADSRKSVELITFEKQTKLLKIKQVWTLTTPIA